MSRALCGALTALSVLSGCSAAPPVSAAKFVKVAQDAPRGQVTASAAVGINFPEQPEDSDSARLVADVQAGGFWTEAATSWFTSERYDATVGVSNGTLLYEGNLSLLIGQTRLGLLHGVGARGQLTFGDETDYILLAPLVGGLFFQHSTSDASHIYGAARYMRTLVLVDGESAQAELDALSVTLGYMMMGGERGLQLAPELGVIYGLGDGAGNRAILLGLSMSANFL